MASPCRRTFQFGIVRCSTLTIPQAVDEVRQLLRDRSLVPRTILDLNAHIYNLAAVDEQLRQILCQARVVFADGMSVVWASRLFGVRIPERCNVTEAFRAFLTESDISPNQVIMAGAKQEEVDAAAAVIAQTSSHCRVVQTYSGFLTDTEYGDLFAQHPNIDMILLGMSTPKTQRVAALAGQACPRAIVWGIGAGTIKILAGSLQEAPVFWRSVGLQWLYRLAIEPRALWRRYVLGNPLFVARVLAAHWLAHSNKL